MPVRTASTPPIRRGFPFSEFKLLDEARGTFEGYLAITGTEDQGGDIIEQGAFTKTLQELKSRQQSRHSRYILPIFWGHDPSDPIGGFTDAYEDERGLYVCGELDLDIEQGRRAYSGLKKGYSDGLSIGYFAIKAPYDRAGVRHLKEVSLFEGSITPVPMHPDAIVSEVKSASGKADWPLAARDRAWDGGAAHKRIVAWATDSDGNVDVAKLKSVHFYSPTGDAAENVSAYKLLYCDVISGDVQAVPKGIFACAGSHGVEATTGISADDKDAIKGKIAAYYKRMAKEFDDDSIVAPWEKDESTSGGKGKHLMTRRASQTQQPVQRPAHLPQGKAQDFQTTFAGMMQGDTLQREWAKVFNAFVMSMWNAMIDAKYPPYVADGETAPDPADAVQANIDAFSEAVADLAKRSIAAGFIPCLDDDNDSFADPDDEDDDDERTGYMARDLTGAEQKRGALMSAANHKELGGYLADADKSMKALAATHKSLKAFHAKMAGDTTSEPATDDTNQPATPKNGKNDGKDAGKSLSTSTSMGAGRQTTASGDTTPQAAEETADLTATIRERLKARLGDKRSA